MDVERIERQFRTFFWLAIPLIVLAIIVTAFDLLLKLGWGYSYNSLHIAISLLVFAFIIRAVGLWIIANIAQT